MGIFSSCKKDNELILIFDIRSASVGGALFLTGKDGIPKIIYSTREIIQTEENISLEKLLSLTLKSLEVVSLAISRKGLGKPSKIFCTLSSPWFISQNRIIKFKKENSFVFTSKLADELIKKEILLFEEEFINKHKNTKYKVTPIEFKNMAVILNGYHTRIPLHQKTKELEMDIFISMSEENFLESIKKIIDKNFDINNIKFSSSIMSLFTVVRDMFLDKKSFLLINVCGEMTDISLVKNDVLNESISFPLGFNFFIRENAKELKCTNGEARSLLSLYKADHIAGSTLKKIEPIIKKSKMEWLKKFEESLSNMTKDIYIPSTIFMTIDGEYADFFSEIIKEEKLNQHIFTDGEFKVFFLNTQFLHGIALFDKNIDRDPYITIEAIYINNFLV